MRIHSPSIDSCVSFTVTPSPSNECSDHQILDDSDRAASFYDRAVIKCDNNLNGWYRFKGPAGDQLSEHCVPKIHCGTHSTGWLNGTHPAVNDGVVSRWVCFNWKKDCCTFRVRVHVRNCKGFYVYKLAPVPSCNLRYCGITAGQGRWKDKTLND